jgi:DNA-binding transcriptional ArsR family regulator
MSDATLHKDQIARMAETFALLGDPTRLSIVSCCMEQEKPAGQIAEELGLSAALASHHLRLLRAARILKGDRRGKQVLYSMDDACVESVLNVMSNHLFGCDHGGSQE